jgi:hypothetical protein
MMLGTGATPWQDFWLLDLNHADPATDETQRPLYHERIRHFARRQADGFDRLLENSAVVWIDFHAALEDCTTVT